MSDKRSIPCNTCARITMCPNIKMAIAATRKDCMGWDEREAHSEHSCKTCGLTTCDMAGGDGVACSNWIPPQPEQLLGLTADNPLPMPGKRTDTQERIAVALERIADAIELDRTKTGCEPDAPITRVRDFRDKSPF